MNASKVSHIAKELGVAPHKLHYMIKKSGIKPISGEGRSALYDPAAFADSAKSQPARVKKADIPTAVIASPLEIRKRSLMGLADQAAKCGEHEIEAFVLRKLIALS